MITSIARQSVIIKCKMQKSVLLGNYEFYYAAGLMNRLFGIACRKDMSPEELIDYIHESTKDMKPEDPREAYLLELVKFYEPLGNADDQTRELFEWGEHEEGVWQL